MASPAGTYVITASDQVGMVSVTINYDPASPVKALRNVGAPGRCLVADNATSGPYPYWVVTPEGTLTGNVPLGHSDLTVSQITAQSGITDLTDISMGLGPLPAR
jgi:hypothetical protein